MSRDDYEQLKQVAHADKMGVWDVDIASGTVHCSPEIESICGMPSGTFAGTYQTTLQCVHPEDRARIDQVSRELLVAGSGAHAEFRLVRPDGEVRWVESFGRLLRDEQHLPRRVVGVAIDITERKQMEQALRASNEELIHFSYAASHDLQEPLRAVIAYGQLLEKRVKGQLGEDAANCLRFIRDGASRLDTLLRDIRIYTEVSQDATDTQAADFIDCNSILQDVCADLHTAISENAAVITHDLLPFVPGRKIHFVELFQNLLSNAIKYRASEAPTIHVSAELTAGECVFSVRDNGIGIALEDAKEIFSPFKRLRRDVPGTGMGLAICKRILERAGGCIWVESEPSRGSTFYFSVRATHNIERAPLTSPRNPIELERSLKRMAHQAGLRNVGGSSTSQRWRSPDEQALVAF